MRTPKPNNQLSSLLSQEENLNFYKTISKTAGAGEKRELLVNKGPMRLLERLLPNRPIQLHNKYEYPAYRTLDHRGEVFTFYLRRGLADLMMRDRGIYMPKGYVVKLWNDDDVYDLQWSNLKITAAGPRRARNSFMTHYLIELRLTALLAGMCPDEFMQSIIAANIGGATND